MKLSKLFTIGIINTVRMNCYYLGLKGLLHPQIIASKNLKIKKLSGTISIVQNAHIKIGFGHVGTVDEKYRRSLWQNEGNIVFLGDTFLGTGTRIVNFGELEFGGNSVINADSEIICYKNVKIGADSLISWGSLIMDTDFHKVIDAKSSKVLNENKEIIIGNHVWIGCRCLILKGTVIPDGAVIGAGSTVTKELKASDSVYLGNSILRSNVVWKE